MPQKILTFLCIFLLVGCVAEKRTILFVPVDSVLIVPGDKTLSGAVDLSIEDLREASVIQVQTGMRRDTQLALYPEPASMVEEIITKIAAEITSSRGAIANSSGLRASILKFDVNTRRAGQRTEMQVTIEVQLEVGNQQAIATGFHSLLLDDKPVRKDFQFVVHAALAQFANELRAAMVSLVPEREI